jgi:WD40 repeat protein
MQANQPAGSGDPRRARTNQIAGSLLLILSFLFSLPFPVQATAETNVPVATDQYGDPLPAGAVARLGPRRHHHGGQVRALAFTPDGKRLVGYTFSAMLVWDAATGKIQKRLPFPVPLDVDGLTGVCPAASTLAVPEVLASPGGEFAAHVHFYDLQTRKKTRTLMLPGDKIKTRRLDFQAVPFSWSGITLSFSADGKFLLVGNNRMGLLRAVEVMSGQVRIALGGASSFIHQAAATPDGKTLVGVAVPEGSDSYHPEVQLWNLETAKLVRTFQPQPAPVVVEALAFSPDSKLLALSMTNRILLYDLATGARRAILQLEQMGMNPGLSFTPDGHKLVSVSEGLGIIRVWEVNSGKLLQTIQGGPYLWRSVAVSPDGRTMALGSRGNVVRLWDIASEKEFVGDPVWHDSPIQAVAFTSDGKTLMSSAIDKTLFWDLATAQVRRALAGRAGTASFSQGGKYLAIASARNQVLIRDMARGGEELPLFLVPGYLLSMNFSRDGRNVLTMDRNGFSYTLRGWNVDTGKQQVAYVVPVQDVWSLAPTPDHKKAVVVHGHGGLSLYHLDSGRQIRLRNSTERGESLGNILDLSEDGRVLITGGRQIRQWELVTGKQVGVLEDVQVTNAVTAHTKNGRYLACGANKAGQGILLWDLSTGKQVANFGDLHANVTALTFGPGDFFLAAGLHDGSILIFDVSRVVAQSRTNGSTDMESLWADLGGSDVGKAHEAIWKMVASKQAVPFLRSRLRPVPEGDRARLKQQIADLDSPRFAVRQAAARELEKNVSSASGLLREALKNNPPLETSRRLQQLLKLLDLPGPETVRTIRATMALERIGGAEARAVLEALARGVPGANETEEARASLERMR